MRNRSTLVGGHLEREARLAAAAGARQRDEPHVVPHEQRLRSASSRSRPMKAFGCAGRLVGRLSSVVSGGNSPGRPSITQLVELLRPREVLEPVLAQVAQPDAVVEQRARRLGEQHLPAVAGSHHPRGLVDVEPDVAPVDEPRLARVEADPHPDLVSPGQACSGERALGLRGRRGSVARRGERDEERVALAVDLNAAVALECLAEQRRCSASRSA